MVDRKRNLCLTRFRPRWTLLYQTVHETTITALFSPPHPLRLAFIGPTPHATLAFTTSDINNQWPRDPLQLGIDQVQLPEVPIWATDLLTAHPDDSSHVTVYVISCHMAAREVSHVQQAWEGGGVKQQVLSPVSLGLIINKDNEAAIAWSVNNRSSTLHWHIYYT